MKKYGVELCDEGIFIQRKTLIKLLRYRNTTVFGVYLLLYDQRKFSNKLMTEKEICNYFCDTPENEINEALHILDISGEIVYE
jgi:hypothetical protein